MAIQEGPGRSSKQGLDLPTFSTKTRGSLSAMGLVSFTLEGTSIRELKNQGLRFRNNGENITLDNQRSIRSEIAINPNHPFIPDSNNKTLEEQLLEVRRYEYFLRSEFSDVRVIIPNAASYSHIAHKNLKINGERLLGYKNRFMLTRTEDLNTVIGDFKAGNVIDVDSRDPEIRYWDVSLLPVIIPTY